MQQQQATRNPFSLSAMLLGSGVIHHQPPLRSIRVINKMDDTDDRKKSLREQILGALVASDIAICGADVARTIGASSYKVAKELMAMQTDGRVFAVCSYSNGMTFWGDRKDKPADVSVHYRGKYSAADRRASEVLSMLRLRGPMTLAALCAELGVSERTLIDSTAALCRRRQAEYQRINGERGMVAL